MTWGAWHSVDHAHAGWHSLRELDQRQDAHGIGLEDPGITGEMPVGVLAIAVERVEEQRCGRVGAGERPIDTSSSMSFRPKARRAWRRSKRMPPDHSMDQEGAHGSADRRGSARADPAPQRRCDAPPRRKEVAAGEAAGATRPIKRHQRPGSSWPLCLWKEPLPRRLRENNPFILGSADDRLGVKQRAPALPDRYRRST
jgi:hypothetical protein